MQNLEELNHKTISIIKDVGSFIRDARKTFDSSKVEHKGLNDLVSYVDKEAEKLLVESLSKLLPGSTFITEEETIERTSTEYTWIIDPLDGTTNFIHGLPVYSISVALYQNNEPIIGVVYEIGRDECFYAWKGGKAFMNKTEIKVSATNKLRDSLVATGFPYTKFEHIDKYLEILKGLMCETHGIRRMGSAAVDLAYVACGRFDAFFEYNLNAWDVAAGAFIVQQAGGKVSNFSGGNEFIESRQITAANPEISKELTRILSTF